MKILIALVAFTPFLNAATPPRFHAVTIDDKIQIGYGVAVADVDGDKFADVLLADKKQFVWYRNPGPEKAGDPAAWQKFIIAEDLTMKDNVCIAAQDIDGDGKCEIAVGAEWNPGDTEKSGAVFYLIPPADRTQRWEPVKLHAEPTTHRMRWIRVNHELPPLRDTSVAKGATIPWGLVVVPLHGRGNKNGEGAGVKVLLYHPPAQLNDPKGEWKTELIDGEMHMTHNFSTLTGAGAPNDGFDGLVLGGREGIRRYVRRIDGWIQLPENAGSTEAVGNAGGVGEVREPQGTSGDGFLVTVEPMHGNRLMVYPGQNVVDGPRFKKGIELTDKLSEGHALACGDLLGTGSNQIVVGWRGKPGDAASSSGVSLWSARENGSWEETVLDGMSCEDLQLADLNGDGKLDIIASGRGSKNVKIFLNEVTK
ncbi:MAG: repeat protein [Chthoniobacteraceae bacterium]|nr:repeat protein [Chthoniobacteraceae bacterium]